MLCGLATLRETLVCLWHEKLHELLTIRQIINKTISRPRNIEHKYNMKNSFTKMILGLVFLFTITSCEKLESLSFKNRITNSDWTQKVGFSNNTNYGQNKLFYKLSFLDNDECIIIYNRGGSGIPKPIVLDTVQIKYSIENNKIIFPEPYGTIHLILPGLTDTVMNAYFSNWEKKSINGGIIHLEKSDNQEKYGYVISPREIYIEPINK